MFIISGEKPEIYLYTWVNNEFIHLWWIDISPRNRKRSGKLFLYSLYALFLGTRTSRACLKNGQHLTQKNFMLSPFKNWSFWFPYILTKKYKKSWFLVNSCCFWFAIHANLMSDGKKKRPKFLFMTSLILLINMSISLFRWTVWLIKTQKFFATKTAKLCSIILMSKIIKFYRYTGNEKSNT